MLFMGREMYERKCNRIGLKKKKEMGEKNERLCRTKRKEIHF
jgi:hypothetical protein